MTPNEAKQRVSSREFAQFEAKFDVSPWGHEALVEQLAIFVGWFLKSWGQGEVDVETLIWRPYLARRKNRDLDELSDEELEELEAENELAARESQSEWSQLGRKFSDCPLDGRRQAEREPDGKSPKAYGEL